MCCCINNLVQTQKKQCKRYSCKAYSWWHFDDSYESKHVENSLMRHEGLHMEWSHFLELAILKDNYTNDLNE